MYTFRLASVSDLPAIYGLQNSELRERILITPLPSYEKFAEETSKQLEVGQKCFYLLEKDGGLEGFIDFDNSDGCWSPTFWSRWLNTLVYGCCKSAFELLDWPKIHWYVRQNNKRMMQICERCRFRKTGEGNFCNITAGFSFLALGKATYFELTAEEYRERADYIERQSLPVVFV